ncbi:hypothetical protein CDD81_744 [Ophiocordyceps australis]|uniref:Uncharacterized protein n=1 Tax=Ophiocordyceps australis TaxID=1399860 RepID=A0A2C5XXE0_9HYPO|nr:hypothetical protein CDD81_744 [Ophiocordyceps australis]
MPKLKHLHTRHSSFALGLGACISAPPTNKRSCNGRQHARRQRLQVHDPSGEYDMPFSLFSSYVPRAIGIDLSDLARC